MGIYVNIYDEFDTNKIKIYYNNGKKYCYIHYSILKSILKNLDRNSYLILGWDAIIFEKDGIISPVDLIIETGPESDKNKRNKNALLRDYPYFITKINELIQSNKYESDNVYVDLVIDE